MVFNITNLNSAINAQGSALEDALDAFTDTTATNFNISTATVNTVNVQVAQSLLEMVSGAGKVFTDQMKAIARKLS